MKIKFDTESLVDCLEKVSKALPKKSSEAGNFQRNNQPQEDWRVNQLQRKPARGRWGCNSPHHFKLKHRTMTPKEAIIENK